MDYSMEIDQKTTRRKRCRDDDAADDFAQAAFPSAKKTRQFHFASTSAADAFASAFALAQSQPFQQTSASTSTLSSSQSYSSASSPTESGQSSPGPDAEDPFHAMMAVDSWGTQGSSLMEDVQSQPQQDQHQHQHSQPTLHTPPGRRGMIIAGWNQARRNDNLAPVVQCWPQR